MGRCRRERSHRRAAGCVRGDGPPGGPLPSPIAGDEPDEQRRGLLPPCGARQGARRPPARGATQPASERSPPAPARVSRLLAVRAAVHADAGVDRLIVQAVSDRSGRGQEPGRKDRRQRVEMTRQAAIGADRAGLVASSAQEPSHPHRREARCVFPDDDLVGPAAVAPEVEGASDAGRHAAVGAEGWGHRVDRWKGGGVGSRDHAPSGPTTGTGRGRSLVALAPPPFPHAGGRRLPPTTPPRAPSSRSSTACGPPWTCAGNDHAAGDGVRAYRSPARRRPSTSRKQDATVPPVGTKNMNSPSHVSEKGCHLKAAGSYLLSHSVAAAVPSAQRGLTSVFGMGTGVALSLSPPAKLLRARQAKARRASPKDARGWW